MANHKATITGTTTGSVTEDDATAATGLLTVTDSDPGEAHTVSVTDAAATYGTWSVDAGGNWIYHVDSGNSAVQALGAGKTLTDHFTVSSLDGSATKTVTITIHGVNDVPSFSGDTNGAVTEDTATSVTGTLTVSDVDAGESGTHSATGVAATYGHWTVDTAGHWKYTLDNANPTVQALRADQTLSDSFTIVSKDGSTSQPITITIQGTNDVATLGGGTTASVTEDTTLSASGSLTITDKDTGQAHTQAVTNAASTYGTWSVDADGHWSYLVNNGSAAVQGLGAGKTLTDKFTVASLDGSATKTVTVTIHGVNDPASMTGPVTRTVKEDGTLTASGKMTVSDADTGEAHLLVTASTATSYGHWSVSSGAPSTWQYVLDNNNSTVQALGANQTLTDTFTIRSQDGTAHQTVTITITGTNDLATLTGGTSAEVTEGTAPSASGSFIVSDIDTGEAHTKAVNAAAAQYGTWSVDADGHWAYQLDQGNAAVQALAHNQTLSDSFTVASTDGTASKTVTVTIHGADVAPSAPSDADPALAEIMDNAAAGTPVGITLHSTDADSPTLTYLLTDTAGGTFTVDASTGVVSVAAGAALAAGTYTVTGAAYDGEKQSATQDFTIIVDSANHAPVAESGSGSGNEDTAITGQLAASDVDGDTLTYSVADKGQPAHGAVTVNPDGSYSYTPGADYNGADSFSFAVDDGHGGTATATVSLTINPVNDAPVANPASASGDEDTVITGQLVATDVDGDTLTYSLADKGDPAHGSVVINADGSYSYTPAADYNGSDSFTYQVDDGNGGSATATVSLAVNPVNDAPVASDLVAPDSLQDHAVTGQLSAEDVDGDTLTYALAADGGPAHGDVAITADGSFTYTPTDGYFGTDSFDFVVSDGNGGTDTGTAHFAIHADTAPLGFGDSPSGDEDTVITGQLTGSDLDAIYGDTLTFALAPGGAPAYGTIVINPDGSYSYTPSANYNGTDQFSFTVTDSVGLSATAPVSITINPVNDPPGAPDDVDPTANLILPGAAAGTTVGITLSASDIDSASVTYVLASDANGSFTIDPITGVVSVATGASLASGTYTISAVASDGELQSAAQDFTITVNTAPTLTLGSDTALVSTDASGVQGNGASFNPAFSPDGSAVAFYSAASNLAPADTNGKNDIFVKDLHSGAVTQVSTSAGGVEGNKDSFYPFFSPDGSKVAFYSAASNLVSNDKDNTFDYFVKDLGTGAVALISTTSAPVFTPDSSKVVFESFTKNLVSGDKGVDSDVFLQDLKTGAITLLSSTAAGVKGNGDSADAVLSADGGKAAFDSAASNLVAGDTNSRNDIFVKDIATGAITLVSSAANGVQGNTDSFAPVFSPDGTKVAFYSYATNLVSGDTNGVPDVFVKDLVTGAITLVSSGASGIEGNLASIGRPVFSPDGGKIMFFSSASNLVAGDTNGSNDYFVKDLHTGAITLVNSSSDGIEGDHIARQPVFSPDGSRVVFLSAADNLVPGDSNGTFDVFMKDLNTGVTTLVASGVGDNANLLSPRFSPDGSEIIFQSSSGDLVPGDANGVQDVFVKDLYPGLKLASVANDPVVDPGTPVSALLGPAFTDADAAGQKGIAIVGLDLPAASAEQPQGTWQFSTDGGAHWSDLGAVAMSNATVLSDTALLRFVPIGSWSGVAELKVLAWDQTDGHLSGDTGVNITETGGASAYGSTQVDAVVSVMPAESGGSNLSGSTSSEILSGGKSADSIHGNDGSDIIFGNGGADHFFGDNGDDTLHVADTSYAEVHGGSGTDTLAFDGANLAIDLHALVSHTDGIERIDLTGGNNSSLSLQAADVLSISDDGTLAVFGGGTNAVNAAGEGWTAAGTQTVDGHVCNVFTATIGAQTATLLVDQHIPAQVS